MSRVVVVGAGIGGLTSALLLARSGHDVLVCERDRDSPPVDPEDAWASWPRPGTPQARLGHSFLPGFRRILTQRLEDVLHRVLSSGAPLLDQAARIPDDARRSGDDELTLVMARRPVFEAVLGRCAAEEPRIALLRGCTATGLAPAPAAPGRLPQVTGVRTRGTPLSADVVIVAGGRSVPIVRWLAEIGAVAVPEESEGCGFACYTRYFRLRAPSGAAPAARPTIHRESDSMVYEIWGADRGTFAAEIIVPVADRAFHPLKDTAVWMGTALLLPDFPDWIDPQIAEPITPGVDIMGQERNVLRRFAVEGRPLARGVHVIGDARCQTDSLFAWGCGNALIAAAAAADAITDHPADFDAQALAIDAAIGRELEGRFEHSRARDRAALRAARGDARWDDAETGTAVIDELLWPAADLDPQVFRAVQRWDSQLDPVDSLAGDDTIVRLARQARANAPRVADAVRLPSRDELAAIVTDAALAAGR